MESTKAVGRGALPRRRTEGEDTQGYGESWLFTGKNSERTSGKNETQERQSI